MAKTISGILALPRVSRNGVFYWPQELAKFHGAEIPLRFNHIKTPEGIVGRAKLTFDEAKMQVTYIATITDKAVGELVDNHNFQVSLGAKVSEPGEICHPNGECFEAPVLSKPTEMSIVETPGMPESTLNIIENKEVQEDVHTFYIHDDDSYVLSTDEFRHTGDECPKGQKKVDGKCVPETNEDKHVADCPEGKHMVDGKCVPIEEFRHVDDECPKGQKKVDGKCVAIKSENTSHISNHNKDLNMTEKPQDKSVEEKTKITIETDGIIVTPDGKKSEETETITKKEDCGCGHSHPEATPAPAPAQAPAPVVTPSVIPTEDELNKTINQAVDSKIAKFEDKIKTEHWTPKSEVQESQKGYVEEAITDKFAEEVLDKLDKYGYAKFVVDKEAWMENNKLAVDNTSGEVQELVTNSSFTSGVKQTTNIIQLPGGKVFTPIRQFGQFQSIPTGQNTARFYTLDNPNFGAITEQHATDIAAGTHVLTSIDVTCNVRGLRQTVLQSELEDFPANFLTALKNQMRTEAIKDESQLVLETLASTANDFGATPFHCGGDGIATTDTTEEDADIDITKAGLTIIRRVLEADGYSPVPGNLVAFIHPLQYEALLTDSNISTLIEQGLPNKSVSGIIESYLGMQIIVTTTLLGANNAHRNIVLFKGAAFALASQRNLIIEMAKTIERQTIDIVATHRIGVDELDKNAYVIVSTPDA